MLTIHINLNMIFYTHVEHSPTKTIHIKYYMEKQTHALHTHMTYASHTQYTRTHTCAHTHANRTIIFTLFQQGFAYFTIDLSVSAMRTGQS